MRIASLVALLSFIHVTIARLLQINQWHEIPMLPCQRATLDFSLFGTCERFSLVFTSDRIELNRLSFTFDGEVSGFLGIHLPVRFIILVPAARYYTILIPIIAIILVLALAIILIPAPSSSTPLKVVLTIFQ
ncbi:unnamed protein product [Nippostrongylus brasiliensis]|uniref:Secreted protein n=1 Tax=Nippostrongylus brasiliensis TaxID=27835 RepID=A0A0N4YZC1_NIPBR|nr:unnamed protein product [Nippostrongylus brasiliensis]